ncbi:MAG: restriction endonuclease subunit S [Anaerolineaceae bacterium]|nr:restriction endonuclease subunit S [Anaerolineaceae bacterium]
MTSPLLPDHETKDSGVPWLGEVPSHWDFKRGKWLFTKMSRPAEDNEDVVTCFRDGVVTLRKNRRLRGFTESLKEIGYQGIRKGDLVIHAMDAFAGAVGVSDSDGKGTPVYSVCKPCENVSSEYYAFLVREMARSQWILALAKGIRERSTDFRYSEFGNQYYPLPPLDEQQAIVRYLDYMDKRIQRFIRARKKMIKLLNEQKQAVIHQAVTRGLNPDVPLKPSGVEWLGDIPEHWEVIKLKYLASKFGSGITPKGGAQVYKTEGIPLLRSQNIHFTGLKLEKVAFIEKELHQILSNTHVKPADVLLNITGASIGRTCSVPMDFSDGNVNQHVCIIRPIKSKINSGYLSSYLSTPMIQKIIMISSTGASREGLTLDKLRSFEILLPPRNEQDDILEAIKEKTNSLNYYIEVLTNQITKTYDYRTRLIADVVTGKLDVRAAAAALPDEGTDEMGLEGETPELDELELDEEVLEEEEGV